MRVCREECQAVHLASIYTGLVWLPLVLLHAWNSAQGLLLFGTGGGGANVLAPMCHILASAGQFVCRKGCVQAAAHLGCS